MRFSVSTTEFIFSNVTVIKFAIYLTKEDIKCNGKREFKILVMFFKHERYILLAEKCSRARCKTSGASRISCSMVELSRNVAC